MGRVGIISPVKQDWSNSKNLFMSTLSDHGMSRFPGTGVTKVPYKERGGKYRTGIDPKAAWIKTLPKIEQEIEIERAKKELEEIQDEMDGVDLSPTSKFWNWTAIEKDGSPIDRRIMPVTLKDMDNIFDFSDVMRRLAFNYVRVHPTIGRSLDLVMKGFTQPGVGYKAEFYVKDEELEDRLIYEKKKLFNDAKAALTSLSPTRKKQIARLMGQHVVDDTKEEAVYNILDDKISKIDAARTFLELTKVKAGILTIKDIVKQALTCGVLRINRGDKIYRGEALLAESEADLVSYLLEDKNLEELKMLEKEITNKRSIFVED
jgi:hypothetical protein